MQRIIFLVFLWWNVSMTCFWRCVNKTYNPFYFWNVMYFTVKQYLMRKKVGQDLILPIKNGLDCVKYLHKSSLGEGLKMRSRWCHWKEKLFQMQRNLLNFTKTLQKLTICLENNLHPSYAITPIQFYLKKITFKTTQKAASTQNLVLKCEAAM